MYVMPSSKISYGRCTCWAADYQNPFLRWIQFCAWGQYLERRLLMFKLGVSPLQVRRHDQFRIVCGASNITFGQTSKFVARCIAVIFGYASPCSCMTSPRTRPTTTLTPWHQPTIKGAPEDIQHDVRRRLLFPRISPEICGRCDDKTGYPSRQCVHRRTYNLAGKEVPRYAVSRAHEMLAASTAPR